jgi:hypothetical protein
MIQRMRFWIAADSVSGAVASLIATLRYLVDWVMNVRFSRAQRHKLHQLLFSRIRCRHFTSETALLHSDNPIAQRNDFREFRGDDNDRSADFG